MDDLAEKLTELLQNPEGMETVKNLAASFLNSQSSSAPASLEPELPSIPFSPDQLQGIMKVTSALKDTSQVDEKTRLLIALKPHLCSEKQEKVDKAIKMIKMIKILPLVQDSGLFSFF